MEENNNHHVCTIERHPILKHLLYGLMALIGALANAVTSRFSFIPDPMRIFLRRIGSGLR